TTGRSFIEWTAASTRSSKRARWRAAVNRPAPPISERGRHASWSPSLRIQTSDTGPARRSAAHPAFARARALEPDPRRTAPGRTRADQERGPPPREPARLRPRRAAAEVEDGRAAAGELRVRAPAGEARLELAEVARDRGRPRPRVAHRGPARRRLEPLPRAV